MRIYSLRDRIRFSYTILIDGIGLMFEIYIFQNPGLKTYDIPDVPKNEN